MTITSGRRCSAPTRFGEDCWNPATRTEDGKPYCHLHAPSYIEAKKEERKAQVEANYKALYASRDSERLRSQQADLFPELLAALEAMVELATPFFSDNLQMEVLRLAKAAIAKAQGQ